MRRPLVLAAASLLVAAHAIPGQASAKAAFDAFSADTASAAQAASSFGSCMRKRYGPHYFRGVKRAHRYFMAQACGG